MLRIDDIRQRDAGVWHHRKPVRNLQQNWERLGGVDNKQYADWRTLGEKKIWPERAMLGVL